MAGVISSGNTLRKLKALGQHESPPQESQGREEFSPNFFQIRKKFEEKSKILVKNSKPYPVLQKEDSHKEEEQKQDPMPVKFVTEFQKLYPNFKEQFTKRQFTAMENCFNDADKNQDGFLESKEIKQMLADHKHQVNLCDADIIVSLGDHDQDGKLSPKEFLELCKPTAESIRLQQHMEGSFPPSDKEFLSIIVEKLRSFVNPVSSKVKGTRQFFESMITSGAKASLTGMNSETRRPLRKRSTSTSAQRSSSESKEGL